MVTGGEIWLLPVLWQIPELKQAPNKLWALQCLGKKPRCLLSYLEWNYYLPPSLNISFQHQKYKPKFEKHISVTIPRAVIMFSVTCGPDLNTCNRLVNLWVICINHRPVNPWHQGPIISPYWQSWHEKAILQFRKKLIATTNYVYQRLLLLGHIVHCKI